MRNSESLKIDIINSVPPKATSSYCPIPHGIIIDEIFAELKNRNYQVRHEQYMHTKDYGIVSGNISLYHENSENTGIIPSITFVNSYNKYRTAQISSGAMVLVCANGMIRSSGKAFSRKHLGNAAMPDFLGMIRSSLDNLNAEFEILQDNVETMKRTYLTDVMKAALFGDIYLNYEMMTPTQVSIFNRENKQSKVFTGDTAWDFYNNMTESFKENTPLKYDKQHVWFHSYMSDQLQMKGARNLFTRIL
jgi:hypothetical protein